MHIQSYLKPVYAKNLCSYWTHVIIIYGVLFPFPAFSIGSIFLLVFMSITSDKLITEKHCLECKPSVLGFVFVGFFSNHVTTRQTETARLSMDARECLRSLTRRPTTLTRPVLASLPSSSSVLYFIL